jgi:hypothetical protein
VTATKLTGVCRADRRVRRPLIAFEAEELSEQLQAEGLPVTVQLPVEGDPQIVLWPALALTTREQVHAMHVVKEATDAPVRWAGVA